MSDNKSPDDTLDNPLHNSLIFQSKRMSMVKSQIEKRGITNRRLLDAMEKIERHLFVGEQNYNRAYEDHPLPIDQKQTISQPYIVALMTQILELTGSEKVLEIGTGSGYQTAILAELADEVYTIERFSSLKGRAEDCLKLMGYDNIHFLTGDGSIGWTEHSPYDRIIVTAAAPHIPEKLFEQLRAGGRMVVPVGRKFNQELQLILKTKGNQMEVIPRGGCIFVPLIGEDGWKDE